MIKLNIRNDKNKIVKTYQTEEVNLKMGTVEDIVVGLAVIGCPADIHQLHANLAVIWKNSTTH